LVFFASVNSVTSPNAMANVRAKHANCSVVAAQMSTEHHLVSQPQSRIFIFNRNPSETDELM